ncbi:MAG: oxidoreductase [Acidobacteria bacterium RIFCSPLOWO2_02_FULL_59_13]|nr:MAG: oxidoreductase [Acidobacteria bacterium RIFCSPLOWO2_02_FULL_59_13]
MTEPTKVAVVGVGRFGQQHVRVYHELPEAELVGIFDADAARCEEIAKEYGCRAFTSLQDVFGQVQAASVAVPTKSHAEIGCKLLEAGIDVLVEKPIAASLGETDALIAAAEKHNRILQVGHLERFNPAVEAARAIAHSPLFFEAHRLSIFSPRSLDIDVVLDLMIHDLDIVLSLVDSEPEEIHAVGLPVLTPKVDIANVRIGFQNGCVANFTASRVSTEQVRKLRWFQPQEYVSVDYARQNGVVIRVENAASGHVAHSGGEPKLTFRRLDPPRQEPLQRQLQEFLRNVQLRQVPTVDGKQGRRALELAHHILERIHDHTARLQKGLGSSLAPI